MKDVHYQEPIVLGLVQWSHLEWTGIFAEGAEVDPLVAQGLMKESNKLLSAQVKKSAWGKGLSRDVVSMKGQPWVKSTKTLSQAGPGRWPLLSPWTPLTFDPAEVQDCQPSGENRDSEAEEAYSLFPCRLPSWGWPGLEEGSPEFRWLNKVGHSGYWIDSVLGLFVFTKHDFRIFYFLRVTRKHIFSSYFI